MPQEDSDKRFQAAAAQVKLLSKRPDPRTLLQLYAYFKQASEGNCQKKRPGVTDVVGRAKHDAWMTLADMPQEKAKHQYVALVDELVAADQG